MNATDFIKEHGVEKARKVIDGAPDRATTVKPSLDFKHFMYGICENAVGAYILLSDLKRLVESIYLVKEHHTLDRAIEYANSPYTAPEIKVCLLDVIADYRSIYGGEHV